MPIDGNFFSPRTVRAVLYMCVHGPHFACLPWFSGYPVPWTVPCVRTNAAALELPQPHLRQRASSGSPLRTRSGCWTVDRLTHNTRVVNCWVRHNEVCDTFCNEYENCTLFCSASPTNRLPHSVQTSFYKPADQWKRHTITAFPIIPEESNSLPPTHYQIHKTQVCRMFLTTARKHLFSSDPDDLYNSWPHIIHPIYI